MKKGQFPDPLNEMTLYKTFSAASVHPVSFFESTRVHDNFSMEIEPNMI
jgi:hypothetical protein